MIYIEYRSMLTESINLFFTVQKQSIDQGLTCTLLENKNSTVTRQNIVSYATYIINKFNFIEKFYVDNMIEYVIFFYLSY